MRLTERQRYVLYILSNFRRQISEIKFHSCVRDHQEFGEKLLYSFSPKYWSEIDKTFHDNGSFLVSDELHADIEEMREKGYIVGNNVCPLLIRARKPEILYGRWFQETIDRNRDRKIIAAGNFEMQIFGKKARGSLEEMGGDIRDGLGLAHFWGKRWSNQIEFSKLYDLAGTSPDAAQSEILYQGRKKGRLYQGKYSQLYGGEIPYFGDFILTRRKEDLPPLPKD